MNEDGPLRVRRQLLLFGRFISEEALVKRNPEE